MCQGKVSSTYVRAWTTADLIAAVRAVRLCNIDNRWDRGSFRMRYAGAGLLALFARKYGTGKSVPLRGAFITRAAAFGVLTGGRGLCRSVAYYIYSLQLALDGFVGFFFSASRLERLPHVWCNPINLFSFHEPLTQASLFAMSWAPSLLRRTIGLKSCCLRTMMLWSGRLRREDRGFADRQPRGRNGTSRANVQCTGMTRLPTAVCQLQGTPMIVFSAAACPRGKRRPWSSWVSVS